MSEYVIEAHGLCKSFRSRQKNGLVRAVDGVDLLVRHGETFGLLGADGAGKTTTLRLLNGLLRPDRGEARVAGFDTVREFHQIHKRAGYMPQQFALYGDMSVRENLAFFARVHGLTQAQQEERIPRLLRFARLEPFQNRLAAQLSGGMKKKLALACMLVHEPEIAFLDEPTLGVDPVSRREFWNLLSDLRAEKGLTVFVCTPYMDEAERCHRVGLMYEGRLIACDTPQAIKRMVPGELLELRPSALYAAREVVRPLEGVLEVQTYGDLLHIFVDNVRRRAPEIQAALEAKGITVSGMRAIEPRMEEAFVSLIRRQGRQTGGQAVCS
ncbi:MAG: ABC transporter ATP-binding protein [Chloroflexi bacterium]|nr:ABC transporter ATP-binding protein [Chloroflexota bacterium]